MATLSHLIYPQIISFSSSQQNRSSSLFFPSRFLLNRSRRQSIICLASTEKSSRKLMSDEDLCNVLREFVASVGLPEGHVPSTKDLSKHGRKDLANIVRRRGHKVIKELLSNTTEAVTDVSDTQQNLTDEVSGIYVHEETGQKEKVNDLSEESADITLVNDSFATKNNLETKDESAVSADDISSKNDSSATEESLETKYESEVSRDNISLMKDSSAAVHSLETKCESAVGPDDNTLKNDSSAVGNSLDAKYDPAVSSDDQNLILMESAASLLEKVDTFMRYGQLDTVEDDLGNDIKVNSITESESSSSGENFVESQSAIYGEVDVKCWTSVGSDTGINGSLMIKSLPSPPTLEDNATSDSYSSALGKQDGGFHVDASKTENAVEINHLKHMLHQKELELSRLKEEIEKEKEALSILQAKAESEISKAQMLISEKDAELHSAEESLSGLVEAKIQYSGEGQMVEVAGSFNGWHQRIKLEPPLSSRFLDPTDTRFATFVGKIIPRKSRLWSTTLWLYPGVYEIKFVVDGEWKIDPQKESTIKGGIENNLLRVDR